MHRLEIKNFGPIKELNIDVKSIMIFIGPQAAGKSTVSKLIYFFRSIRNDFIRILRADTQDIDLIRKYFIRAMTYKFRNIFGSTRYMENASIAYYYDDQNYIQLTLTEQRDIDVSFSETFNDNIAEIIIQIKKISPLLSTISERMRKTLSASEMLILREEIEKYFKEIELDVNKLFHDDYDVIYVPAGRSLATVLSEQLQTINIDYLDYLMGNFIEMIINHRPTYHQGIQEIINNMKLESSEIINLDEVNFVVELIRKILKGEYKYQEGQEGKERIYINNNTQYVKIQFASSGQQEILWILLFLFKIILDKPKIFLVVEEPEAHLYPVAQRHIVNLLSFVMNATRSQLIVTTHSPYIMTSLNNLVYAGNIGNKKEREVNNIVDKRLWVDANSLSAFHIEDGYGIDIIDRDLNLINVEEIDRASIEINEIYDNIYNLDDSIPDWDDSIPDVDD